MSTRKKIIVNVVRAHIYARDVDMFHPQKKEAQN